MRFAQFCASPKCIVTVFDTAVKKIAAANSSVPTIVGLGTG